MSSPPPKLPPHPGLRNVRRMRLIGFGFLGIGVFGGLTALGSMTAVFGIGGVLLVYMAQRLKWQIEAVQLANAANQHVTREELDEARSLLDAAAPSVQRGGYLGGAIGLLRAIISLYRGTAQEAVTEATFAATVRGGFMTAGRIEMTRCSARAVRALAQASLRHDAEAEADAASVVADPYASSADLARAQLARAVILAGKGETEALGNHLREHAVLLLGSTPARERALVRALRRMTRLRKRSVYREPSPPVDTEKSAGDVADWVAKIAPDAAAFVVEGSRAEEAPRSTGAAAPAGTWADRGAKRRSYPAARVLALWAVLVAMFLAIWQILTPPVTAGHHAAAAAAPASFMIMMLPALIFVVIMVVALTVPLSRVRAATRELLAAQREVALGHHAEATARVAPFTRAANGGSAASALLVRGDILEREGQFADALTVYDEGLARIRGLPKQQLIAVADLQLPSLLAARAYCLAVMGDPQAGAELAALKKEFPLFHGLAIAEVRVRLMMNLMKDDLEAAAAVARERTPTLTLPLRDDVLCDLTLAMTSESLPDEELDRVDAEMRDDEAHLGHWIGIIAPSFRELLNARLTRSKVRLARDSQLPPRRDHLPSTPDEAPSEEPAKAQHDV